LTDSAKSTDAITVSVEESFVGVPGGTTSLSVPFRSGKTDSGDLANSAWLGVEVAKNLPVTVLLAQEKGLFVFPGLPVLVTSSPRDTELIRSLTKQAQDLRSSPDLIFNLVASLSTNPNPPLAGFLVAFIPAGGKGPYSRDQVASLYSELLGSLQTSDVNLIAEAFLIALYPDSTPATQIEIVQRLAEYAQCKDPDLSQAALKGLIRVADLDHSLQTAIPPASMVGLQRAYRESVENGSIPRSPALEEGLGIKN
jgi:hypothetical protein